MKRFDTVVQSGPPIIAVKYKIKRYDVAQVVFEQYTIVIYSPPKIAFGKLVFVKTRSSSQLKASKRNISTHDEGRFYSKVGTPVL